MPVAAKDLSERIVTFQRGKISAIDGLRGIAVLLVVNYHYFNRDQNIGFIGVDIFFMISGFVITRMILEDLSSGLFSIKRFYFRRWQRLAPAYLMLLVIVCIVSVFALLPTDLNHLSNGLFFNVISLQNFYFQSSKGYFDNNLRTSPILHTWSLAVEEQFYILFPLMMLIFKARSKYISLFFVICLCLFSMYICFAFGSTFPAANFYLLPFRAFELLAGAILAMLRSMKFIEDFWFTLSIRARQGFAFIAILSTFISSSFVEISAAWPNYTVLPLVICFLALLFSSEESPARIILGNKVLVQIGKLSYSIYLLHFPLLKLFENFQLANSATYTKVILIVATIVLAYISYRFIEQPFRTHIPWRITRNLSFVLILIICTFSLEVSNSQGFVLPKYDKDQIAFIDFYARTGNINGYLNVSQAIYGNGDCELEDKGSEVNSTLTSITFEQCVLQQKEDVNGKSFILWGDSHAFSLAPGIMDKIRPSDGLIALTRNGCRPSIESNLELSCLQHNLKVIKLIQSIGPSNIIVSTVNELNLKEMRNVLQYVENFNHKILLVGPAPSYLASFSEIFASKLWESKIVASEIGIDWQKFIENKRSVKVMNKLADSNSGIRFINLYSVLCTGKSCQFRGDSSSQEIFTWDVSHLSVTGAKFVAPYILKAFDSSR